MLSQAFRFVLVQTFSKSLCALFNITGIFHKIFKGLSNALDDKNPCTKVSLNSIFHKHFEIYILRYVEMEIKRKN